MKVIESTYEYLIGNHSTFTFFSTKFTFLHNLFSMFYILFSVAVYRSHMKCVSFT